MVKDKVTWILNGIFKQGIKSRKEFPNSFQIETMTGSTYRLIPSSDAICINNKVINLTIDEISYVIYQLGFKKKLCHTVSLDDHGIEISDFHEALMDEWDIIHYVTPRVSTHLNKKIEYMVYVDLESGQRIIQSGSKQFIERQFDILELPDSIFMELPHTTIHIIEDENCDRVRSPISKITPYLTWLGGNTYIVINSRYLIVFKFTRSDILVRVRKYPTDQYANNRWEKLHIAMK